MPGEQRLDEVFTFDDQLSFLIPHEWVEGDPEGSAYLYHSPDGDSGWLRVSLVTSRESSNPAERLHDLFRDKPNYWMEEETENLVYHYEKDAEQDGDLLHIYYWLVGNLQEPDLIQEAIFSYTVLRDQVSAESNREMIAVLSQVLPRALFHLKGEVGKGKPS